jgi:hypothetical protein
MPSMARQRPKHNTHSVALSYDLRMDLRTMECFLAVVEEGSIARAGRVFAERTRRLLGHVEETSEAVRSIGQGVSGTIAIAIGSSVAPGLVAGLLRASRWWRSCAPIIPAPATSAPIW